MKPEDFVPQVVDAEGARPRYGTMLVNLEQCAACKRPMVRATSHAPTFPAYFAATFEAQAKRADWGLRSEQTLRDEPICRDCAAAGMAASLCALCKKERPSDQIQASVGDPSEHLCTSCYETVPAKLWDEAVAKLEEDHKYDFE